MFQRQMQRQNLKIITFQDVQNVFDDCGLKTPLLGHYAVPLHVRCTPLWQQRQEEGHFWCIFLLFNFRPHSPTN